MWMRESEGTRGRSRGSRGRGGGGWKKETAKAGGLKEKEKEERQNVDGRRKGRLECAKDSHRNQMRGVSFLPGFDCIPLPSTRQ